MLAAGHCCSPAAQPRAPQGQRRAAALGRRHRRRSPSSRGGRRSCSTSQYAGARCRRPDLGATPPTPRRSRRSSGRRWPRTGPAGAVHALLRRGQDEFTDAFRKRALTTACSPRSPAGRCPTMLVIGHTDKVGTDAVNDPLSRQRAEVVRKALVARGVAPENIVVIGRGKRATRSCPPPTASPRHATGASRSSCADAITRRRSGRRAVPLAARAASGRPTARRRQRERLHVGMQSLEHRGGTGAVALVAARTSSTRCDPYSAPPASWASDTSSLIQAQPGSG